MQIVSRCLKIGATAGICLLASQAYALDSGPTLLAAFKNWSALQSVSSDGKSCYAMSQPKSSEPKKAKRDPIYFLINTWPARRAKDEVEVVSGYQFKPDSSVTVDVGGENFDLFTKNDGSSGGAWVKDEATETRLINAMRRGSKVVVSGTSMRGTVTHDTYLLGGIGEALDKAHATCGM